MIIATIDKIAKTSKFDVDFNAWVHSAYDHFYDLGDQSVLDSLIRNCYKQELLQILDLKSLEKKVNALIKIANSTKVSRKDRINSIFLLGYSTSEKARQALINIALHSDIDWMTEIIIAALIALSTRFRMESKEVYQYYFSKGGSDGIVIFEYIAGFYLTLIDPRDPDLIPRLINNFSDEPKTAIAKGLSMHGPEMIDVAYQRVTGKGHGISKVEVFEDFLKGQVVFTAYDNPNRELAKKTLKKQLRFKDKFEKGLFKFLPYWSAKLFGGLEQIISSIAKPNPKPMNK